jgi:peptidoglycan/xylan/chitin deacetylase (PgdA/CDA1 family)
MVRVAIIRVETKPEFDIQLNHHRLKARLNHHYVINFQARADRPRSIFLGFAKAHEPWDGLGLYKKIELTTEWQTFEEDFVATANDTNARIHFDVGGSDIPVELSSVTINSIEDVASIKQHSTPIRPGKLEQRKVLSRQLPEWHDRLTVVRQVGHTRSQGTCRGLILTYHHIVEVPSDPWSLCVRPQHFAEHLEILKKRAQPLHVRQLSQSLQNEQMKDLAVVVTFDDGYADNLHNARPLLEQYDIPATVFLTTGYIGDKREFWWDELDRLLLQPGKLPGVLRLSINGTTQQWDLGDAAYYSQELWQRGRSWRVSADPPSSRHSLYLSLWRLLQRLREKERQSVIMELRAWANEEPKSRETHRALSVEEVSSLAGGGLIELGCHTVTHSVLSVLPVTTQREEIQYGKTYLEDLIGRPITSFAYPYGSERDYTMDTISIVQESGFECACSTRGAVVTRNSDRFQLPRFQVQDWDGDEFARRLSQWFDD